MTIIGLAYVEDKPQDHQQLHGGKTFWSNKKMPLGLILYFGMVYILKIIDSLNSLFMFLLCYEALQASPSTSVSQR